MSEIGPYFAAPSAQFARHAWTRRGVRNTWTTPVALVLALTLLAFVEVVAWEASKAPRERPICVTLDANQTVCFQVAR